MPDGLVKAGAGPELAVRMAQIYQWDIDFLRDLRQGDRFVVVVDRRTVEGEFYEWGTIFAARFVNGKRTLDAVVYPDDNGRLGYYDIQGLPLRKQFLRSPLKFSRVTSRFSMSRFHPVLKRRMPHYGVDYGAPVGTPVVRVVDPYTLEVRGAVSEREAVWLRAGARAAVTMDGASEVLAGRLHWISVEAATSTGKFPVEVSVALPGVCPGRNTSSPGNS